MTIKLKFEDGEIKTFVDVGAAEEKGNGIFLLFKDFSSHTFKNCKIIDAQYCGR